MQLPIKTEGVGAPTFIAGGTEVVLKDRRTGEVRIDDATGETLHVVHTMVFIPGQAKPDVWSIRVVGEPKGVVQGQPVRVVDLMASDWEFQSDQGMRHGISGRAGSIGPATATASSAKAAA